MKSIPIRSDTQSASLAALADQINVEHHKAETALNDGLHHALEAGRLLLLAKRLCTHGTWAQWLAINFHGSARTARAYTLVAARLPQIEKQNGNAVANLSFRQALQLTAAPHRKKSEPIPKTLHNYVSPVDEELLAAIPEISTDRQYFAMSPEDPSYFCEVYPSIKNPGFFHLVIYENLDTDNSSVVYDRRGVRYDRHILAYVLKSVHGRKPMRWGSNPASGEEIVWLSAPGIPAPFRSEGLRR